MENNFINSLKAKDYPKVILPKDHELSEDQVKRFEKATEYIYLDRVPFMPFSSLKQYLDEYNLIMDNMSKLSGSQRIHVKNVIHSQVRLGKIILKLKENDIKSI